MLRIKASIIAASALCAAQSNLGGKGYVDLAQYGGSSDGKGAGILYGLPNDPAYSPESAPSRSVWGPLIQGAGVTHVRAGGAQIPFPGYSADVQNGNTQGYDARFASARQNYQDLKALNPTAKFVLLPHDIWGADSVTNVPLFPCDSGDCTEYGRFLDKLTADLRNNNMLDGLQIDIWNEPDGANFWAPSQDQYLQQWDYAYNKYREAFGTSVELVGPSTASQPSLDNGWWTTFAKHLSSNGLIPDWWSAHQLNGRGSPNCGNDPVQTQQQLNDVLGRYNLPQRPFQLNEYGAADEQVPAYTAWFIGRFERTGITGLRANWGSQVGLHNDAAKLLGPGGSDKSSSFYKLGDWHVLNYYTKQQKGAVTLAGATESTCYDLFVTQERDKGVTHILAGTRGQTGSYPITISNIDSMPAYNGKKILRALIREIPSNGRVDEPTTVSNGTVNVENNQVLIELNQNQDSAYTIDLFTS